MEGSRSSSHESGEIRPLRPRVNVSGLERCASILAGAMLALGGLRRGGSSGALLVLAGGPLIGRGVTGHCLAYGALGIGTGGGSRSPVASVPHHQGIKVERVITVNRPPEELYRLWRDVENLPRFMEHLEKVEALDGRRSRWRAKGPGGRRIEWEAEIINERENELIAWRSLPGADVGNAGSVRFSPAPGGRGSEVKVTLEYKPPAGPAGALVAKLLGSDPASQVREDLRRFKQVAEAGEVATTRGQPSGREVQTNSQEEPTP